jgi:hypothetical protein
MEFSELEKNCMRAMVSAPLEEKNLGTILADNILNNGRGIHFVGTSQKMELFSQNGDKDALINEMFTFAALVNYLKNSKYIYTHHLANKLPGDFLSSKSNLSNKNKVVNTEITVIDTSVGKEIRTYTITFFHPCTSLVELVENDFVTSEKANHMEQMSESRKQTVEAIEQTTKANIAIILSAITVLLSVILPLISKYYGI